MSLRAVSIQAAAAPKKTAPAAPPPDDKEKGYSCQLCHRTGRFAGCGGWESVMIRGSLKHVHTNCARFSPLCEDGEGGKIRGIAAEIRRGNRMLCTHCKRPGATMGCTPDECDRNYHLPCAASAGAQFDAVRHVSKLGGVFCKDHLFIPEAAGAIPARGSVAAWERAYLDLRAEVAETGDLQAALEKGREDRTYAGLRLTAEQEDEEREKLLEHSITVAEARGCRCSVCSIAFRTGPLTEWTPAPAVAAHANPHSRDHMHLCSSLLTLNAAKQLGSWHASLRDELLPTEHAQSAAGDVTSGDLPHSLDDDNTWWISSAVLRCASCETTVHAGCYGVPPSVVERLLRNSFSRRSAAETTADKVRSNLFWLCEHCERTRRTADPPPSSARELIASVGIGVSRASPAASTAAATAAVAVTSLVAASATPPEPGSLTPHRGAAACCLLCGHGTIISAAAVAASLNTDGATSPKEVDVSYPPRGSSSRHAMRSALMWVVCPPDEAAAFEPPSINKISVDERENYGFSSASAALAYAASHGDLTCQSGWVHASCALWHQQNTAILESSTSRGAAAPIVSVSGPAAPVVVPAPGPRPVSVFVIVPDAWRVEAPVAIVVVAAGRLPTTSSTLTQAHSPIDDDADADGGGDNDSDVVVLPISSSSSSSTSGAPAAAAAAVTLTSDSTLSSAVACNLCGSSAGATFPSVGTRIEASAATSSTSAGAATSSPFYAHASCAVGALLYQEQVAPRVTVTASSPVAAAVAATSTAPRSAGAKSKQPWSKKAQQGPPDAPVAVAPTHVTQNAAPATALGFLAAAGGVALYGPGEAPIALFCSCGEPYDRFMVECDGCREWFHGMCANLTKEDVEDEDTYLCASCTKLQKAGRSVSESTVQRNTEKAEAAMSDMPLRPSGVPLLVPPEAVGLTLEDADDEHESELADAAEGSSSGGGGAAASRRSHEKRLAETAAASATMEEVELDAAPSRTAGRKRKLAASSSKSTIEVAAADAPLRSASDSSIGRRLTVDSSGAVFTTTFVTSLLMYQLRTWCRHVGKLVGSAAAHAAFTISASIGSSSLSASATDGASSTTAVPLAPPLLRPTADALIDSMRTYFTLFVPFGLTARSVLAGNILQKRCARSLEYAEVQSLLYGDVTAQLLSENPVAEIAAAASSFADHADDGTPVAAAPPSAQLQPAWLLTTSQVSLLSSAVASATAAVQRVSFVCGGGGDAGAFDRSTSSGSTSSSDRATPSSDAAAGAVPAPWDAVSSRDWCGIGPLHVLLSSYSNWLAVSTAVCNAVERHIVMTSLLTATTGSTSRSEGGSGGVNSLSSSTADWSLPRELCGSLVRACGGALPLTPSPALTHRVSALQTLVLWCDRASSAIRASSSASGTPTANADDDDVAASDARALGGVEFSIVQSLAAEVNGGIGGSAALLLRDALIDIQARYRSRCAAWRHDAIVDSRSAVEIPPTASRDDSSSRAKRQKLEPRSTALATASDASLLRDHYHSEAISSSDVSSASWSQFWAAPHSSGSSSSYSSASAAAVAEPSSKIRVGGSGQPPQVLLNCPEHPLLEVVEIERLASAGAEWVREARVLLPRASFATRRAAAVAAAAAATAADAADAHGAAPFSASASSSLIDPSQLRSLVARGRALGMIIPELSAATALLRSYDEWVTKAESALAGAQALLSASQDTVKTETNVTDTVVAAASPSSPSRSLLQPTPPSVADVLQALRTLVNTGTHMPIKRLRIFDELTDACDRISWRERAEDLIHRVSQATSNSALATAESQQQQQLSNAFSKTFDSALARGSFPFDHRRSSTAAAAAASPERSAAPSSSEDNAAAMREEMPGDAAAARPGREYRGDDDASSSIEEAEFIEDPRPRYREIEQLLRQAPRASISAQDPFLCQLRSWEAQCGVVALLGGKGSSTSSSSSSSSTVATSPRITAATDADRNAATAAAVALSLKSLDLSPSLSEGVVSVLSDLRSGPPSDSVSANKSASSSLDDIVASSGVSMTTAAATAATTRAVLCSRIHRAVQSIADTTSTQIDVLRRRWEELEALPVSTPESDAIIENVSALRWTGALAELLLSGSSSTGPVMESSSSTYSSSAGPPAAVATAAASSVDIEALRSALSHPVSRQYLECIGARISPPVPLFRSRTHPRGHRDVEDDDTLEDNDEDEASTDASGDGDSDEAEWKTDIDADICAFVDHMLASAKRKTRDRLSRLEKLIVLPTAAAAPVVTRDLNSIAAAGGSSMDTEAASAAVASSSAAAHRSKRARRPNQLIYTASIEGEATSSTAPAPEGEQQHARSSTSPVAADAERADGDDNDSDSDDSDAEGDDGAHGSTVAVALWTSPPKSTCIPLSSIAGKGWFVPPVTAMMVQVAAHLLATASETQRSAREVLHRIRKAERAVLAATKAVDLTGGIVAKGSRADVAAAVSRLLFEPSSSSSDVSSAPSNLVSKLLPWSFVSERSARLQALLGRLVCISVNDCDASLQFFKSAEGLVSDVHMLENGSVPLESDSVRRDDAATDTTSPRLAPYLTSSSDAANLIFARIPSIPVWHTDMEVAGRIRAVLLWCADVASAISGPAAAAASDDEEAAGIVSTRARRLSALRSLWTRRPSVCLPSVGDTPPFPHVWLGSFSDVIRRLDTAILDAELAALDEVPCLTVSSVIVGALDEEEGRSTPSAVDDSGENIVGGAGEVVLVAGDALQRSSSSSLLVPACDLVEAVVSLLPVTHSAEDSSSSVPRTASLEAAMFTLAQLRHTEQQLSSLPSNSTGPMSVQQQQQRQLLISAASSPVVDDDHRRRVAALQSRCDSASRWEEEARTVLSDIAAAHASTVESPGSSSSDSAAAAASVRRLSSLLTSCRSLHFQPGSLPAVAATVVALTLTRRISTVCKRIHDVSSAAAGAAAAVSNADDAGADADGAPLDAARVTELLRGASRLLSLAVAQPISPRIIDSATMNVESAPSATSASATSATVIPSFVAVAHLRASCAELESHMRAGRDWEARADALLSEHAPRDWSAAAPAHSGNNAADAAAALALEGSSSSSGGGSGGVADAEKAATSLLSDAVLRIVQFKQKQALELGLLELCRWKAAADSVVKEAQGLLSHALVSVSSDGEECMNIRETLGSVAARAASLTLRLRFPCADTASSSSSGASSAAVASVLNMSPLGRDSGWWRIAIASALLPLSSSAPSLNSSTPSLSSSTTPSLSSSTPSLSSAAAAPSAAPVGVLSPLVLSPSPSLAAAVVLVLRQCDAVLYLRYLCGLLPKRAEDSPAQPQQQQTQSQDAAVDTAEASWYAFRQRPRVSEAQYWHAVATAPCTSVVTLSAPALPTVGVTAAPSLSNSIVLSDQMQKQHQQQRHTPSGLGLGAIAVSPLDGTDILVTLSTAAGPSPTRAVHAAALSLLSTLSGMIKRAQMWATRVSVVLGGSDDPPTQVVTSLLASVPDLAVLPDEVDYCEAHLTYMEHKSGGEGPWAYKPSAPGDKEVDEAANAACVEMLRRNNSAVLLPQSRVPEALTSALLSRRRRTKWAKHRGFPFWPAQLISPASAPQSWASQEGTPAVAGKALVLFLGAHPGFSTAPSSSSAAPAAGAALSGGAAAGASSGSYAWVRRALVRPWGAGASSSACPNGHPLLSCEGYATAVSEAEEGLCRAAGAAWSTLGGAPMQPPALTASSSSSSSSCGGQVTLSRAPDGGGRDGGGASTQLPVVPSPAAAVINAASGSLKKKKHAAGDSSGALPPPSSSAEPAAQPPAAAPSTLTHAATPSASSTDRTSSTSTGKEEPASTAAAPSAPPVSAAQRLRELLLWKQKQQQQQQQQQQEVLAAAVPSPALTAADSDSGASSAGAISAAVGTTPSAERTSISVSTHDATGKPTSAPPPRPATASTGSGTVSALTAGSGNSVATRPAAPGASTAAAPVAAVTAPTTATPAGGGGHDDASIRRKTTEMLYAAMLITAPTQSASSLSSSGAATAEQPFHVQCLASSRAPAVEQCLHGRFPMATRKADYARALRTMLTCLRNPAYSGLRASVLVAGVRPFSLVRLSGDELEKEAKAILAASAAIAKGSSSAAAAAVVPDAASAPLPPVRSLTDLGTSFSSSSSSRVTSQSGVKRKDGENAPTDDSASGKRLKGSVDDTATAEVSGAAPAAPRSAALVDLLGRLKRNEEPSAARAADGSAHYFDVVSSMTPIQGLQSMEEMDAIATAFTGGGGDLSSGSGDKGSSSSRAKQHRSARPPADATPAAAGAVSSSTAVPSSSSSSSRASSSRSAVGPTSETSTAASSPSAASSAAAEGTTLWEDEGGIPSIRVTFTGKDIEDTPAIARRVPSQAPARKLDRPALPPSLPGVLLQHASSGSGSGGAPFNLLMSGRMAIPNFLEHAHDVHEKSSSRALCLFSLTPDSGSSGDTIASPAATASSSSSSSSSSFRALMRFLGREGRIGVVHDKGGDFYVYIIPPVVSLAKPEELAVRKSKGRPGPAAYFSSTFGYARGSEGGGSSAAHASTAYVLLEYRPANYKFWQQRIPAALPAPAPSLEATGDTGVAVAASPAPTPSSSSAAAVAAAATAPAPAAAAQSTAASSGGQQQQQSLLPPSLTNIISASGGRPVFPPVDPTTLDLIRQTAAMCAGHGAGAVQVLQSQELGPQFEFINTWSPLHPIFLSFLGGGNEQLLPPPAVSAFAGPRVIGASHMLAPPEYHQQQQQQQFFPSSGGLLGANGALSSFPMPVLGGTVAPWAGGQFAPQSSEGIGFNPLLGASGMSSLPLPFQTTAPLQQQQFGAFNLAGGGGGMGFQSAPRPPPQQKKKKQQHPYQHQQQQQQQPHQQPQKQKQQKKHEQQQQQQQPGASTVAAGDAGVTSSAAAPPPSSVLSAGVLSAGVLPPGGPSAGVSAAAAGGPPKSLGRGAGAILPAWMTSTKPVVGDAGGSVPGARSISAAAPGSAPAPTIAPSGAPAAAFSTYSDATAFRDSTPPASAVSKPIAPVVAAVVPMPVRPPPAAAVQMPIRPLPPAAPAPPRPAASIAAAASGQAVGAPVARPMGSIGGAVARPVGPVGGVGGWGSRASSSAAAATTASGVSLAVAAQGPAAAPLLPPVTSFAASSAPGVVAAQLQPPRPPVAAAAKPVQAPAVAKPSGGWGSFGK